MFEKALITRETQRLHRPKWLSLPAAVMLHVCVGTIVAFAQYWKVDEVPEPPINVVFVTQAAPPPPPPAAPAPAAPKPVQQEAPAEPVEPVIPDEPIQPEEVAEIVPDAAPMEEMGGTLTGDPAGGDPNGVVGGEVGGEPGGLPGGMVGGDPNGQPGGDDILRVGGGVSKPEILTSVPPKYTSAARKARQQGAVVVEAIIDEQGRVINARVVRGLPMGLDQEALSAVQQWRFKPAMFNGRPVKVYFTLTVNFQVQ